MSLSSINDMDSHNLIIGLYSDALESDNTIPEPQFTIDGNDYSTLTWSGTTMAKPTEAQLVAKYNSIKTTIRDKLVRERRDRLLIESDKYAVKDFPFRTKTKRDQWITYRSNLRNLTQNISNFTLDLNNFEISNFDTHKPTEPEDETGLETKTFDENDIIVDGKFIITGHNTLNNFLVGDGISYVPKTPSQIRAILDLEVGTDVQAYNSGLNAIANISPSNNKIAVFSGQTTAKLIDFRDEDDMISDSSTAIPSQQSVKAYVDTKVSNLIDSAPGTLDTLNELASALGDNANFSTTISTSLGEKLVKSSNLSDLTNASTARSNLGLTIGSDVQAYNANLVPVSANPGSSEGGDLSTINIGGTNYSIPSGGSSGITISNNADNRILTGDGTNANAEANMTFSGTALNVIGTITCDTSLTIDTSVLDASDILHISDITAGTATGSKALVLNSSMGASGIGTLGCSTLSCPSFSTSSNANIEIDPNGSGVVVFKGNSTRGSGQFKLNCENNSHGITIKGPPHSAGATYTLTLPNTTGSANQVLKTDGSGNLSWTSMSSASSLNDLSDVSISSLSSGQVLKYNGTNWVNDTDNTGSGGSGGLPSGVSYTGSGASAEFVVTGNIRATADITAYHSSDRRFKDNLTRISEPNEKIKKINGYEFDWNEKHEYYKNTHDVGVVAQEIEEVLPEVVTEREDGYKAVKYERIIALLIESNKDLLRRVEELEEKLKK